MKTKNNGKRNRTRGLSYERSIASQMRDLGWDKACTSRYASRMKDDQKVDICFVDPFNIQCKATDKCVNYREVLGEIVQDQNWNVVFNKVTGKGEYVIMEKSDFYEIISSMKREGII